MKLEYIVEENNKTVKNILISHFHISHRLLVTLKRENSIFLNDAKILYIDQLVNQGDKITICFDYKEDNSNIVPKEIKLNIVYEDDWLLVINKQAGIPVHPSILHYEDSLSNGVSFYFDKIGLKKKIRPVNRIDKDTSGLVVFAKNEYIQEALIRQMSKNKFYKEYFAIAKGFIKDNTGTINAPISRKDGSIIQRCVNENGDKAITHFEVLDRLNAMGKDITLLKCILETGKTHQIRVHLSYIGHPLLGDDLYGGNTELIKRQALHCIKMKFIHPITNKNLELEAPIANDLLETIFPCT